MDEYLMYLRKSRQDRDIELKTGNFDTLQRHRDALLALAKREGYTIAHIYEEVVSGDTISERPEMQKLLNAVETGAFAGVLVMEIPRLARGNTRDQGTVAETFQYSGTKIITPEKIYDPADEADEEYFEFGLFMSRREYKTINRRLQRGRLTSLGEGKYIAGTAPYGYRKVRITHQKGYTLEEVPESADVVREIFRLYTEGEPQPDGTLKQIGSYGIANLLNARGTLSPGGKRWTASSVRDVLKNPTYAGYIRWAYRPDKKQMVNGVLTVSHPVNKDMVLRKGQHPAIISEETWRAAKAIMTNRGHVPVPGKKQVANPLAGVLRCSICKRALVQLPAGSHGAPIVHCPTVGCKTVSSLRSVVEKELLNALAEWLKDYQLDLENVLETDRSNEELQTVNASIGKLEKNLNTMNQQKGNLYDLLEQGIYTQEVFLERSRVLASRMTETEKQLETLTSRADALKHSEEVQKEYAPKVKNVLDVYELLDTPADKNALLKTILDHVDYSKTVGGKWKESDLKLRIYPKIGND